MDIPSLLGDQAESLLEHECETFPRQSLTLPGPDFVERVFGPSDRSPQVLRNLAALYSSGRLGGTGYVSILPVDQGIEHSGAASFAPNPDYFDPLKIVELAVEGGCNAVATTFGVLGLASRRYAHRIPFIVKLNHNELLTYPESYDQVMFGSPAAAYDLGAAGVGATVYFGSDQARRQIGEVSEAFAEAHELGMFTVLWCYLRNPAFKVDGVDYHAAADLTGQANHMGVTIAADVIKQSARRQRRLPGRRVRQDPRPGVRPADQRPPHRLVPLPGGQLLHGPGGADQQRRGVVGRHRPGRGGDHRGDQQAGGGHRPDLGPQGLPAAHGLRDRAPRGHPIRLPRPLRDRGLIVWRMAPGRRWGRFKTASGNDATPAPPVVMLTGASGRRPPGPPDGRIADAKEHL